MFHGPSRSGGYTLVETVVYVGLVAVVLLAIVGTSYSISTSHKRAREYLDINSAAISAFSRFSRDIRRANTIDLPDSTLGASSGRLTLMMRKQDGSYDRTTFYLNADQVKVNQNGVYEGDVTQANMTVSNLTFRRFLIGTTTAMRIEMTIAPSASSTVPALNFYGTYVMRGSYLQ